MTALTSSSAPNPRQSVFTSADICREAGLALPGGARRPIFNDEMWDFTEVLGHERGPREVGNQSQLGDARWTGQADESRHDRDFLLQAIRPAHPRGT